MDPTISPSCATWLSMSCERTTPSLPCVESSNSQAGMTNTWPSLSLNFEMRLPCVTPIIVTAIVPVYRGERTLAQALSSLLAQDIDGLEVIVIDDGSPDRSADIAITMQEATKGRLTVLRQSNCGLAATLNRGIRLARGKYIARQDQDDIVLAGRFVKQLAYLEANPDDAMVGTWAQIYADD